MGEHAAGAARPSTATTASTWSSTCPPDVPAECDGEPRSWRDVAGSTQGVGQGKTQRLWIADVDGHRLMLVAGYFPGPEGPTPEQVDEMTRMAEGATFVDAATQIAP